MPMKIFEARYSSHTYGLADANSDDDITRVIQDDPIPSRPLKSRLASHTSSFREFGLGTWLQSARLGMYNRVDILYLPDSAYIAPLPPALIKARDERIFLSTASRDNYALIAGICRDHATKGEFVGKGAVHALIYQRSAWLIASGAVPDFASADIREQLRRVRAGDRAVFEEQWARFVPLPNVRLPGSMHHSRAHALYYELAGVPNPTPPKATTDPPAMQAAPVRPIAARQPAPRSVERIAPMSELAQQRIAAVTPICQKCDQLSSIVQDIQRGPLVLCKAAKTCCGGGIGMASMVYGQCPKGLWMDAVREIDAEAAKS